MTNKTKFVSVALVIAATGLASPVSAQSFNPRDGSGNSLPFSYGAEGAKSPWTAVAPQNNPVLVPQIGHGLYNYAGPRTLGVGGHKR